MIPPLPFTKANSRSATWRSPPRCCTWRTASVTWLIPPARPGWLKLSWPPWVLSGKSPFQRRSCSATKRPPSPGPQKPASSSVTSTVIV